MTAPLPRSSPGTDTHDTTQPYGTPSPGLVARAESGLAAFLARFEDDDQADEGTER